jgi:hypothetical protein
VLLNEREGAHGEHLVANENLATGNDTKKKKGPEGPFFWRSDEFFRPLPYGDGA